MAAALQERPRLGRRNRPSESPVAHAPTARPVLACYSVIDAFLPACGFTDLTDGMYEGDPDRTYEAAQARQAESLLDRAGVGAGSQLLDVGCGYGRIVRAAVARGAGAVGITVSHEQVRRNVRGGLDVRLIDYKRLGPDWDGRFDAVIANGSIEHFAQPADAAAGHDDDIYRRTFEIIQRVLDPESASGRFVTTVIHFRRRPDPADWLRPPTAFRPDSPQFHWSRLAHAFGGWYPVRGQLERCARGKFQLIDEEDGTDDYRLTSEECLSGLKRELYSLRGLGVWLRAVPTAIRRPLHAFRLVRCVLGSESWNWQFRGDPPPAVLLRQTWRRV